MNNFLRKKPLLLGTIILITTTQIYGCVRDKTFLLSDNYDFSHPVAFTPDNLYLARSNGSEMTIWEVNSKKLHKTITLLNDPPLASVFSPDGSYFATATENVVNIWDVSSGGLHKTITHDTKSPSSIAFNHETQHLAIGGEDGRITLWDINNDQLQQTFTNENPVKNLVFSSNNQHLASVDGKEVKVWNVGSGQLERTFLGANYSNYGLAFSPDSRYLAIESKSDGTVKIWDVSNPNGQLQHTLKTTFDGNITNSIVFSPDGRYLVNSIEDPAYADTQDANLIKYPPLTIGFWDINTGELEHTVSSLAGELALSNDGRYLAIGNYYSTYIFPLKE